MTRSTTRIVRLRHGISNVFADCSSANRRIVELSVGTRSRRTR